MDDLTGRVALVTGGSPESGARTPGLLRPPAHASRSTIVPQPTPRTTSSVISSPRAARLSRYRRMSRMQSLPRFVRETEARLGPIGVLVNNAGVNAGKPLDRLDAQDLERHDREQSLVRLLRHAGGAAGDARTAVGADHHAVVRRRANRGRDWAALRRQQGRSPRPHAQLREPPRERGHRFERDRAGSHRHGHNPRQPGDHAPADSHRPVRACPTKSLPLPSCSRRMGTSPARPSEVNGGWSMR